jgi:hypothetical protein
MGSGGMQRKGRRRLHKVQAPHTAAAPASAAVDAENWLLRAPEQPPLVLDTPGSELGPLDAIRDPRWLGLSVLIAARRLFSRRHRA